MIISVVDMVFSDSELEGAELYRRELDEMVAMVDDRMEAACGGANPNATWLVVVAARAAAERRVALLEGAMVQVLF